jgi:hypothetical protein
MAWRFALPVVTTMTLAAQQIYFSVRPETKHSFPLAAAGRISPLLGFGPTSRERSSRRSSKKRLSLAPSNACIVPLLHAVAS